MILVGLKDKNEVEGWVGVLVCLFDSEVEESFPAIFHLVLVKKEDLGTSSVSGDTNSVIVEEIFGDPIATGLVE